MTNLCIQDLITATKGTIRMGAMPPLGGKMAPVGRLVPTRSEVQNGDVVVAIPGGTKNGIEERSCLDVRNGSPDPNGAFAMGAFGVIAEFPIWPWDGRFSLQVNDMSKCEHGLLSYIRDRVVRPVVAVIDDAGETLVDALRRYRGDLSESDSASHGTNGDGENLFWQFVASPVTASEIVVQVSGDESTELLSALRPDVVTIVGDISAERLERLIGLAATNGILVLENSMAVGLRHPDSGVIAKLAKNWQMIEVADAVSDEGRFAAAVKEAVETIRQRSEESTEFGMTNQARVA